MGASPKDPSLQVTVSVKKSTARATLAVAVCGLCLLFIFEQGALPQDLGLAALCVAYFIGSCTWLHIARLRAYKNKYFNSVSSVDVFVSAFVCAYFFHSYLIAAALFIALLFNSALIGSLRRAGLDALTFAAGVVCSIAIKQPDWSVAASNASLIIVNIFLFTYLFISAYYIYRDVKKVNHANQKLYHDHLRLKLRTYKLSRYVSPTVWDCINQGRDAALKAERKRLTIFFSDIQGFSALTEELEAETLTDILNAYLTEMVKIATAHGGTMDKFMGDGIMIIFGDSKSEGLKEDCLRSIAMAVDMRKKMQELEHRWFNQGIKKPLRIRMGINTGYCTVGSFGTSEYMDYTVLGTHVNLASRLETAAEAGEILISHETWSLIKDIVMCRDKGEINAKGFSHPIKVYQVVDFRKNLGARQSYFEERSDGFSMNLDLEKVKNFDKDRIITQLEDLAEKLRDKHIN
ncbi:MAG: adenylate cyclase [Flavobacteriales bacterium]|jgi:adenylate cyclase